MAIRQQTLERMASICRNTFLNKILAGAGYGATAYVYQGYGVSDMELSSPQCILLALLYSLVTEDVMSCCLLADVCHHLQQLQSDYLRVWLTGDFQFPHQDMEKAMALFTKLLEAGVLKLPSHVTRIMSSLATKYRISGTYLMSSSMEERRSLENRLEEAVVNNSPGDIIATAYEGGDANGLTQSGERLIHLAVRLGNCSSIAALGFLKANLEVLNSSNVTPLEEAVKNDSKSSVKVLLSYGAALDKHLIRGDTYLHIAASGGHNRALEALLEGGIDVNKKNLLNETPLFRAVGAGNVHGVEMLLEKGADAGIFPEGSNSLLEMAAVLLNVGMFKALVKRATDLKFKDGGTIFHLVAQFGNIEMLNIIYEMKVPSINIQDNKGASALMIALKYSKEDIATFLLHNGADPNMKDKEGKTPLHYAAEGGCVGLVASLLATGVRVNEKDNRRGETPIFIAAVNNHPAILRLLVENGADLALKDWNYDGILHHGARSGDVEIVRVLLDNGATVDMQGQEGKTALHHAAERGHTAVVEKLLDAGAEVDRRDNDQNTALHRAAEGGHTAVLATLLSAGATVDIKANYQCTALHLAAQKGHTAAVTMLLDAGATVDLKNSGQSTALHIATERGHINVVKVLLDAGAAVDLKDQNQKTVLHLAAQKGHIELVTTLLDAGATVDIKAFNTTALDLAADTGHTAVVSVLLDRGADPTGAGSSYTHLCRASMYGHLAVVQLLVDHGAPINDNNGKSSALYQAIQNKQWSVADYLRSKGAV